MPILVLLLIPSGIGTLIFAYLLLNDLIVDEWKWLGTIPLGIFVGTYLIRRGIYEWWAVKHPPGLAKVEQDILGQFFPYYRNLGAEHRRFFEQRLSIFRMQKQFQMRGAEKLPGDIQLLVSARAIQMTMGKAFQKEFFPKLGMIVLFPRTFITPKINEKIHAVEFEEEEPFSSLFISVNMFIRGLKAPHQYYDVCLYGFAKAFKAEHHIHDEDLPIGDRMDFLARLHVLRQFKVGYSLEYTGLPDFELFELASEHFFTYPEAFKGEFPEVYEFLVKTYGQDPLSFSAPALQDGVGNPALAEEEDLN